LYQSVEFGKNIVKIHFEHDAEQYEKVTGSVFMQTKQSTQASQGAVMVVGGGIAGMQAALDLANSGYFVYMVEKSPAIGGAMAQLDKTFPTNDCSM
jgi:heterodisulfide reductase subunit A-like polyferredoxin